MLHTFLTPHLNQGFKTAGQNRLLSYQHEQGSQGYYILHMFSGTGVSESHLLNKILAYEKKWKNNQLENLFSTVAYIFFFKHKLCEVRDIKNKNSINPSGNKQ